MQHRSRPAVIAIGAGVGVLAGLLMAVVLTLVTSVDRTWGAGSRGGQSSDVDDLTLIGLVIAIVTVQAGVVFWAVLAAVLHQRPVGPGTRAVVALVGAAIAGLFHAGISSGAPNAATVLLTTVGAGCTLVCLPLFTRWRTRA